MHGTGVLTKKEEGSIEVIIADFNHLLEASRLTELFHLEVGEQDSGQGTVLWSVDWALK